MPCEGLTPGPDQACLTIGLTDDLVAGLNRFQEVVVIPCQWDERGGLTMRSIRVTPHPTHAPIPEGSRVAPLCCRATLLM